MLLKGKKGIIFGALDSKSIAWKVAEHCKEQGAEFVLTNAPIAMRMGTINELAEKTNSQIIPADATSVEDIDKIRGLNEEFSQDFDRRTLGVGGQILSDLGVTKMKLLSSPKTFYGLGGYGLEIDEYITE